MDFFISTDSKSSGKIGEEIPMLNAEDILFDKSQPGSSTSGRKDANSMPKIKKYSNII
jgi:hypothetical protein